MASEELTKALETISANLEAPEVKEFMAQFNPLAALSKDNVGEFVEKNDVLKSYRDSFHTKGLETWKANNLKKLVDEELAKVNPTETPEQKKIRELEQRLNEEASARKKETLKNQAIKKLTEKGLPVDLTDYLIGQDEETTDQALSTYEKALENFKKSVTEGILKTKGRAPAQTETEPQNIDVLIEKALKEGNNREYVKLMQKKYEKKE